MKKIIIVIGVILTQKISSQTLVGINVDLGNGYVNGATDPFYTSQGGAWGIGTNLHLNTSKRFNPKLNIGFQQKGYVENFKATYYSSTNPIVMSNELIITNVRQNSIHLDLGIRFNILNKKNKLFIDLSMNNNLIVSINNSRKQNNLTGARDFNSSVSMPYYVSASIGAGYNFNNVFSITVFTNPAITTINDNYYYKHMNMYGINLCYYLPILSNKKTKTATAVVAP